MNQQQKQQQVLGGQPVPDGLARVFRCVRPVIFQDPATGIPSIVGTGFLIKIFNEIFFITARHVIDNKYGFDEKNIAIQYHPDRNQCVPFSEVRRYTSLDPDDTDHVDIVVFRADASKINASLFDDYLPYDTSGRTYVQEYKKGLNLYFYGLAPEVSEYDYENRHYDIRFTCGNIKYLEQSTMRSVHRGMADVIESCPDFDGVSGSPMFYIENYNDRLSRIEFAGMALRATRSSQIFHFMDGRSLFAFILDVFLNECSESEAREKLESLVKWHHPDIGFEYRPRHLIIPKQFLLRMRGEMLFTPVE